jgi:MinD superfamily P-loop ATPase
MKDCIIVQSAKGGVGKSTVSEGLAKQYAKKGNVAILDLDISTPNINIENDNIRVITSPVTQNLSKTHIKKFIRAALKECREQEIDYLIIDTPPTINDAYFAINEVILYAKILFVTTPSKNAINDTAIGIRFFARNKLIPIGIVQNMVGEHFGKEFDSFEEFNLPTIGILKLEKDQKKLENVFEKIVKIIDDIDCKTFKYNEDNFNLVMSNITLKEVKSCYVGLPKKFYNLETWDYIREQELENVNLTADFGMSDPIYRITTDEIKNIISYGESCYVRLIKEPSLKQRTYFGEIREAKIIYNNSVSRGTPMFLIEDLGYLWSHEISIIDDKELAMNIKDGMFQVSQGRYIFNLSHTIHLKRMFDRQFTIELEYQLIQDYFKDFGSMGVDHEYMIGMYCSLEEVKEEHTEENLWNNLEDYPEHKEIVKKIIGLI